MKKIVERRKHKRYRVKEAVFAVLKPRWLHPVILGQIINIGRGGLGLHCIPGTKLLTRPYKLRILCADGSFFIDEIPARTISDFETEKGVTFGSIPGSPHGVQFGDLTPSQIRLLDYFMLNYTEGDAEIARQGNVPRQRPRQRRANRQAS